jgi:hypothetical protein
MRVARVAVMLGGFGLAGCATASLNLQRASARAITPTPYPDSVTVSDIHSGLTSARWTATTRDGVYDCSIEGNEKTPICVKRSAP